MRFQGLFFTKDYVIYCRFHEQQTFLSSNNALSIYFVRNHKFENEYVDGAYTFLDGT